jgi:hypothetical protein
VRKKKLFVMAAHEGGLVTFGKDLEQAFSGLIDFRNELSQFDRRQRK